jgi:RNA polymerase primary sigma factor
LNFKLYDWQQSAGRAWKDNDRRGIIEAVTGSGKTMLGLAAIHKALERGRRVAVLVPSRELLYQWKERITEGFTYSIDCGLRGDGDKADLVSHEVVVSIVNSAVEGLRLKGEGLLIADECHRYAAPTFRKALGEEFSERLGLSATYERSDGAHVDVLEPYFSRVVYCLRYPQAIQEDVVARFRVGLLPSALSDEDREEYENLSTQVRETWKRLVNTFGVPAEPYAAFIERVHAMINGGTKAEGMAASNYWSKFQQRRKFLAKAPAKFASLEKLADAIGASNGTLLFTETIESAEEISDRLLTRGVAIAAYHSELTSKERRQRLLDFKSRRLKALSAAIALDEGVDVPDADLGIIVAASRERRQMIQRMGRVLRRKRDGRFAGFVICFAENTNEDPASDESKQCFIEEITLVAEETKRFPLDCTSGAIRKFFTGQAVS